MRAITLTQPWATLVAIGAKTIETRSWSPSAHVARGITLAIHAGQGLGPVGGLRGLMEVSRLEPFRSTLLEAGILGTPELPRGQIVAVATLDGWAPTGTGIGAGEIVEHIDAAGRSASRTVDSYERAFGDYSAGRWLWMLTSVRPLAAPVPCKGALGLWEVPPDALAQIEAQL
jgi:hypothetical protein